MSPNSSGRDRSDDRPSGNPGHNPHAPSTGPTVDQPIRQLTGRLPPVLGDNSRQAQELARQAHDLSTQSQSAPGPFLTRMLEIARNAIISCGVGYGTVAAGIEMLSSGNVLSAIGAGTEMAVPLMLCAYLTHLAVQRGHLRSEIAATVKETAILMKRAAAERELNQSNDRQP